MKNLTNINIDTVNKQLSFTIQLVAEIDENSFMVFVDECSNMNDMYSDQSENHNYYFNIHNSDIILKSLGYFKYEVIIENDVIADMNHHMKYIKVITGGENYIVENIYYNSTLIFNAELTRIKKVCNSCLDDKAMRLLTYVVFKRQLLESALETDDYNQCMILYMDLCRILEIDEDASCCECVCYDDNTCPNCPGGCCSLK